MVTSKQNYSEENTKKRQMEDDRCAKDQHKIANRGNSGKSNKENQAAQSSFYNGNRALYVNNFSIGDWTAKSVDGSGNKIPPSAA